MNKIRRVVCGISGGVDSAVAALKLKQRGFEVHGAFMRNWDLTNEVGVCTAEVDREHAQYVCDTLGVPLTEVNFVKEYWNDVFSSMLRGYEEGVTPNPDILCNKYVKFGHFFRYARETLGADAVATGHYARNSWGEFLEQPDLEAGARLLRSADQHKDQTLFLSQMSQTALQRTMFPVGMVTKSVVKEMALAAGLERIVKKKESTGICFIGKRQFQDFIDDYLEPSPGNFVDLETGQVVGQHQGIHHWTRGQRTHLSGYDKAYFVADIQRGSTDIAVVKGTHHPALYNQTIYAQDPHWINQPPPDLYTSPGGIACKFRYQHVHPLSSCRVSLKHGQLEIQLADPLRAVTKGQYAVLYQGEECLGSAYIAGLGRSLYDMDVREPVRTREGFS